MRRALVAALFFVGCASARTEEADSTSDALSAHHNPVLPVDCPDPGVMHDGAFYYLVCTSDSPDDVFPIRRSHDLVHWSDAGFVFPGHASHPWAGGNFWAPEMHRMADGSYVAYYSARDRDNGRLCVGTATATHPLGPWDESDEPIVCHDDFGVIDPTYFRDDDGQAYLYWKEDGNDPASDKTLHGHTRIRAQRLGPDGLSLVGTPTTLIDHSLDWEENLVEAPSVVKHGGSYFLFYSANSYCDDRYAVGVARASSPLGPFTKNPTGDPILSSGNGFDGPGHGSIVDGTWFVYHAWNAGETCHDDDSARRILVDRISWSTWPTIANGHPTR